MAQGGGVGASRGERAAAQAQHRRIGEIGAGCAGEIVHGGLGGGDRDGGQLGVGRVLRVE